MNCRLRIVRPVDRLSRESLRRGFRLDCWGLRRVGDFVGGDFVGGDFVGVRLGFRFSPLFVSKEWGTQFLPPLISLLLCGGQLKLSARALGQGRFLD